jgi:glycosyltransferase involved in cell wall biosynthesis
LVIADGVSGLHFVANDPESLGAVLADLNRAKPEYLNMLVSGGRAALASRFSEHDRLADYRSLIRASFAEGLGEERTDFNSLSTRRKKAERK